MDWFERLTDFQETTYEETRSRLVVEGDRLRSVVNNRSYGIGRFETPSLKELRERVAALPNPPSGRTTVSVVQGDVRDLHAKPEYRGALFQVASQFNALEMTGPSVTPEDGVTRYMHDFTQGPACAQAAGAATIWRNYFIPIGNEVGQTRDRQLDTFADVRLALAISMGHHTSNLWTMENGYAMFTSTSLSVVTDHLSGLDEESRDHLKGHFRIAMQTDVEVTDPSPELQFVSQAFCSALPIAYQRKLQGMDWSPLASLVLEAAYEATMLSAILNAARGAANTVCLTSLGGGAFGNPRPLILRAISRAIDLVAERDLDVRIVSFGSLDRDMLSLERR